jgi:hypothetical protein
MSETDDIISNLNRSDKHYKVVLIFLFCLLAILMILSMAKTYTVSHQVDQQTTFIVNYLRCIGQIPQKERGAAATNKCFDTYAPKDM